MDNCSNKYKKIIEHAILAGIISEDSKQTYLYGILEENDSELSEIESRLSMEKDENSYSDRCPENKRISKGALIRSDKNGSVNELMEMASLNDCDSHSIISGSTVENYSILDIQNPKNDNSINDDSVSETSSSRQEKAKRETTQNVQLTTVLSKAIKKPMKDQILDFNVPVYIDVKKKKSPVKPQTLNSKNMTQYEIYKMHCGKSGSSRLKANRRVQNASKWTFPKTKSTVTKKQDISSKNMKKFVDVSSVMSCNDENLGDHTEHEYDVKDKSVERKAPAFSSGKKILENQNENPKLISKYLQTELDETTQDYDRQIYTVNTRRRLKVRDNLVDTKQKYKTKENYSMDLEAREQLDVNKKEKKIQISVPYKTDKCKRCEYCDNFMADNTRVLNDKKIAETNNEDTTSSQSISTEKDTCEKDHRRLLNVNIICQFYDDGDVTDNESTPFPQTKNDASKTFTGKLKTTTENASENEKNKKNKKIQFLSRLFSNMKIKKKPN